MNVTFSIPDHEIKAFRDKLKRADETVLQRARRTVAESATRINFFAKDNCPVVTGRLRASINTRFSDDGLTAAIGTNVIYAQHAHEYARNPAQRRFLEYSAKAEYPRFLRKMTELLK